MSFTGNNNRVDQYGYDAAGNLTFDGIHHYSYDDESRIVAVDNGGTGQYVYDADGLRIHRVGSEGPEDYAYDLMGHAITTYASPAGSYLRVELYGGSLHVATYANATTYFDHTDWEGTERVRSAITGGMPVKHSASSLAITLVFFQKWPKRRMPQAKLKFFITHDNVLYHACYLR